MRNLNTDQVFLVSIYHLNWDVTYHKSMAEITILVLKVGYIFNWFLYFSIKCILKLYLIHIVKHDINTSQLFYIYFHVAVKIFRVIYTAYFFWYSVGQYFLSGINHWASIPQNYFSNATHSYNFPFSPLFQTKGVLAGEPPPLPGGRPRQKLWKASFSTFTSSMYVLCSTLAFFI